MSILAHGSTQVSIKGVPRPERQSDHCTFIKCQGQEWVDLYLYSPYMAWTWIYIDSLSYQYVYRVCLKEAQPSCNSQKTCCPRVTCLCVMGKKFSPWINQTNLKLCKRVYFRSVTLILRKPIEHWKLSVGKATSYGLGCLGIESSLERDVPYPTLSPTLPPIQWVPGFFPGGKAAGAWR